MRSKREMMREFRRQADPSFPASAKSRLNKPPPPRPSEPPPARPTELPSRSVESLIPRPTNPPPPRPPDIPSSSSNTGVLKGHKGRNKKKGKKGLRVSFDLNNTQERIVPEEPVVECWEDLSDWGSGAPDASINGDASSECPESHHKAEQPSEGTDYIESVTYFGRSESPDRNADLKTVDEGSDSVCGVDSVVVTPIHYNELLTDLEWGKETSVNDAEPSEIVCLERLTDVNLLEGLTDVTHPDEMNDVSHLEGLTDVSHPDEMNDISYDSVDISRDDLDPTDEATSDTPHWLEVTEISESENINSEDFLDLNNHEMLSGINTVRKMDSEDCNREITVDDLLKRLTQDMYSNATDWGEVTDPSQVEEFIYSNTNENHVENNQPYELQSIDCDAVIFPENNTVAHLEEYPDAVNSEVQNSEDVKKVTAINSDQSTENAYDRVTDQMTFCGVLDTQKQDTSSGKETITAEHIVNTNTENGEVVSCDISIDPTFPPFHYAEPVPDDDDDEWETEPSGESDEVSENTWEDKCENDTLAELCHDSSEEDNDSEILSDDVQTVPLAHNEELENDVVCENEASEAKELNVFEREKSPQVTVGYECRDKKSSSIYGSETESEGEFVPCDDKCVGTTDQSDSESLCLLSLHEGGITSENCSAINMSKICTVTVPEVHLEESLSSLDNLDLPKETKKWTGLSESSKEIQKVSGKKTSKKKGKKNKAEEKTECGSVSVHVDGRPKLVRGKAWKEKREKINANRLLNLSFGSELCESELVEGTSNLLTETYTATSLLTPTRCPLGTTVFTETPCTACSSVSGEFSESDSLHADCKCGEQKYEDEGVVALVAEVKTCDDVPGSVSEFNSEHYPEHTTQSITQEPLPRYISKSTIETDTYITMKPSEGADHAPKHDSPSGVFSEGMISEIVTESPTHHGTNRDLPTLTVQLATESNDEEDDNSTGDAYSPTGNTNEFFFIKTQTVAAPSQVMTEFVEDTESEDDLKTKESTSDFHENIADYNGEHQESFGISMNMIKLEENSIYEDSKKSNCKETLNGTFDYEKSFPEVVGTHELSMIYSYNSDPDSGPESGKESIESGGRSSKVSSFFPSGGDMVANIENNGDGHLAYSSDLGEIVYKGPCLCGNTQSDSDYICDSIAVDVTWAGVERTNEQLCVSPVRVSDTERVVVGDTDAEEVYGLKETSEPQRLPMGSIQEDQGSQSTESPKDIKLRINEIVGGRLRGRFVSPGVKEESQCIEEHHGGQEDSPLSGSSPGSSSGVQGSDEMSMSRSRSRSPSRSISPGCTPHDMQDCVHDSRVHGHLLTQDKCEREALESLRALTLEGGVDPTDKGASVDYSFKTFRDMYQINPVYLTDSDDHDDLNESDTVVPIPVGGDYDPERSITVASWSSSDCSPDPPELRTSPPLPDNQRTKKVPKVTKLLRETQGIVQRWEALQAQAVERQRQSSQVRELQRQVKTLRLALEALSEQASELTKADDVTNRLKLIQKMQEAKALQQEVSAKKTEVSTINLAVHRFLTETGFSLAGLKDDVADLYRLWDEADRRVTSEVSRLENVDATWRLWETQAEELTKMLRQDSDTLRVLDVAIQTGSMTDSSTASMQGVARLLNDKRKTQPGKKLLLQHTKTQSVDIQGCPPSLMPSGDECLSDSGTSGYESCSSEELSERERRLANLRRLARDLEASLHPNSQAWADICKTLSSAEAELKGLQQHCRELVVKSSETLDQTKTSPQLRKRMWSKDSKVGKTSRRSNTINGGGRNGSRGGWVWRVVRAALPFQAALLLLFCVACLLEPNCCDHVNTLNLSLSPQLRYVHGPPPV